MIRSLDPQTEKFLTDLGHITRRFERAQREITSGRRINNASDDPDHIANLLQLRSELGQTEQIRFNLGRGKNEVDTAEQSLQHAVRLMERVSVLGTQGATGFIGIDQRRTIADEINLLLQELVSVSRTTAEGRYIFSGDSDSTAPYTFNPANPDPVGAYQGTASTRQMLHPSGTLFSIARTAQQIFDDPNPDKNVFDAVNGLRTALQNNDLNAAIAALTKVRTAEVHLNNQLAFYGSVQNQVAEALDFTFKQELRLRNQMSELQDADMTTAILDLNESRYQQEVALSTKAKLYRRSLFDYLG